MFLRTAPKKIFLFLAILTNAYMYGDPCTIEHRGVDQNDITEDVLVEKSSKEKCEKYKTLSYFLYTADFINSFIQIPTSNLLPDSTTISSMYLAGRAPIYNWKNENVGTCSASFLCMQNQDGIFTDISNYLSVNNGLIVSWFTPTTLLNLELDTIVHSMVTQCIVTASTKIGFNPFYGKKFNMVVSSDNEKIYFDLNKI